MKKGLVLGLAGLFLLTGCGNKVKHSKKITLQKLLFLKNIKQNQRLKKAVQLLKL